MTNAFNWRGTPSLLSRDPSNTKSGKTRSQIASEEIARREAAGIDTAYIPGIGTSEPQPTKRRAPGHYRG